MNWSVFCFFMAVSWPMIVCAQGIDFQASSWDEAVEMAQAEDKLIFIDAYTTWCAPCKVMDEYVFTHAMCGELYNNSFINLKIDMESSIGSLFGSRYSVTTYPTFLYLTWDGTLVYKSVGYQGIEHLVQEGKIALSPHIKSKAMEDRFAEGDRMPDFIYHMTYDKLKKSDGSHLTYIPIYLDSQKNWNKPQAMHYIFDFVDDVDSDMFKHMAQNKTSYAQEIGDDVFNQKFNQLINAALHPDSGEISLQRREEIYQIAYPQIADKMMINYKLDYYLDQEDMPNYAQTAYEYYTSFGSEDKEGLYQDLPIMETYLQTDEAKNQFYQWRIQQIESDPTPERLLTLGRILMKNGDLDEAKALGKEAKLLLKSNGGSLASYKSYQSEWKAQKKQFKKRK